MVIAAYPEKAACPILRSGFTGCRMVTVIEPSARGRVARLVEIHDIAGRLQVVVPFQFDVYSLPVSQPEERSRDAQLEMVPSTHQRDSANGLPVPAG